MTPKEFIEKAIEGGLKEYKGCKFNGIKILSGDLIDLVNSYEGGRSTHTISIQELLLYPKTWRAVGKAMGWKRKFAVSSFGTTGGLSLEHNGYVYDGVGEDDQSRDEIIFEWHYRWLKMIDALAEGKSITSYLKTL